MPLTDSRNLFAGSTKFCHKSLENADLHSTSTLKEFYLHRSQTQSVDDKSVERSSNQIFILIPKTCALRPLSLAYLNLRLQRPPRCLLLFCRKWPPRDNLRFFDTPSSFELPLFLRRPQSAIQPRTRLARSSLFPWLVCVQSLFWSLIT